MENIAIMSVYEPIVKGIEAVVVVDNRVAVGVGIVIVQAEVVAVGVEFESLAVVFSNNSVKRTV